VAIGDPQQRVAHSPGRSAVLQADEDFAHLLRVGSSRTNRLLSATQTRGGDHFHSLGDLLNVFGDTNSAADLTWCWHRGFNSI